MLTSLLHSASVQRVVAAALLAGCAGTMPPAPGASSAEWQSRWGAPTAQYLLADGARRLEFASGPYGRSTWMVDVDAAGRVAKARQVLNEAEFLAVQSAPGLRRDALLQWLGTPGERRHGGRAGGEVWSYRYPTNDCLWFQVSIGADGVVTGSGYGSDPRCDAPSDGYN